MEINKATTFISHYYFIADMFDIFQIEQHK